MEIESKHGLIVKSIAVHEIVKREKNSEDQNKSPLPTSLLWIWTGSIVCQSS